MKKFSEHIIIPIKKYLNRDRLDWLISRVPILSYLAITIIDILISYVIELDQSTYKYFYYREIEFLKSGLIFNLGWLFIAFRYRLCWYNKVAIIGFLNQNIINLIFIGSGSLVDYHETFTHGLMFPTAVLALILFIKKT